MGSPTSWHVREKHGPSLRERGSPDYSQTAADEREAILNTSHKVYIDRSLAFSRDNHVVDL